MRTIDGLSASVRRTGTFSKKWNGLVLSALIEGFLPSRVPWGRADSVRSCATGVCYRTTTIRTAER
ncbi:hypothetical protein GCM10023318_03960 [Nocardia callitridis]|uniref:Transposase DDE domain-containing protein n=1 Tax=Nocardia callitridis TaxID=648753 RepID=A0ABP9JUR4_9NOCA